MVTGSHIGSEFVNFLMSTKLISRYYLVLITYMHGTDLITRWMGVDPSDDANWIPVNPTFMDQGRGFALIFKKMVNVH